VFGRHRALLTVRVEDGQAEAGLAKAALDHDGLPPPLRRQRVDRPLCGAAAARGTLYDTIKDIIRLELLLERGLIDAGAAIVLSNNAAVWDRPAAPA
jgi:hypothetical protein